MKLASFLLLATLAAAAHGMIWPLPSQITYAINSTSIDPNFNFFCAAGGVCGTTLKNAFARYLPMVVPSSVEKAAKAKTLAGGNVLTECSVLVSSDDESLHITTDESYTLTVHAEDCLITASTVYGAMHGLESFSHIVSGGAITNLIPLMVNDIPRFDFRALMIDTSRHWLPVAFIKHTLDTMAANKLNYLHWHIVDSQSFPCGSNLYPQLSQKGAWDPRAIYSVSDMQDIVAYAHARGIRIIPEWDMPGHGSWGAGMPSLMGCSDVMDPTQNATYAFIKSFLTEMSTIFTDDYFFLGGDEVEYQCWDNNPNISAWLKQKGMTSAQLEQYFWQQMAAQVLPAVPKTIGVWEADNIQVDPRNLPKGSFVNVYQSQSTLGTTTNLGLPSVLSGTWYLDQENPDGCKEYAWQMVWECFYAVDPTQGLTPQQASLVLGGEVCMWGEGVDDQNFDSRTWDRTAAVAERLWSPESTSQQASNTLNRLTEQICRMQQRGVHASPVTPGFCPNDL